MSAEWQSADEPADPYFVIRAAVTLFGRWVEEQIVTFDPSGNWSPEDERRFAQFSRTADRRFAAIRARSLEITAKEHTRDERDV